MDVFVSWASVPLAEEAEANRTDWVNQAKEAGQIEDQIALARLTQLYCLPEYHEYQQTTQQRGLTRTAMPMDRLNRDLLAVRFVVPALEKVVTYQLARRLPPESKMPVSLAARAFLLNTFPGEWSKAGTGRVTFIGLSGLSDFFIELALCCGALGQPLPPKLWQSSSQISLPDDDTLRDLVDACAFNQTVPESTSLPTGTQRYEALTAGWMGTGASAERDSALLLSAAFKLGFTGD